MLIFDDALEIARSYVKSQQLPLELNLDGNKIILFEEEIIEKYYGWYFLWGTSKYHETNDDKYALFSNSPFLVLKKNGKIIELASAYDLEKNIEKLEKRIAFLERE